MRTAANAISAELSNSALPSTAIAGDAPVSTNEAMLQPGGFLTPTHWIGAAALGMICVLVTSASWTDMLNTGITDEESGHILLVPFVVAWLVWIRRHRLRQCPVSARWVGCLMVAFGWIAWSFGYRTGQHTYRDFGAILALSGSIVSVTGVAVLRRLAPAFVALIFLIPIWPARRQQIAWPLQVVTAYLTEISCQVLGIDVVRRGNVLNINGIDVAVAEACNGMRMIITLLLVTYVYAFITPLRSYVRAIILVAGAPVAVACNVIRLVPTVWVFGHASHTFAERFHDITGWLMIGVAFLLLIGCVRMLRWLTLPVMLPERFN